MQIQIDLTEASDFNYIPGGDFNGNDIISVDDCSITISDVLSQFLARELLFCWMKQAELAKDYTPETFFDLVGDLVEAHFKAVSNESE